MKRKRIAMSLLCVILVCAMAGCSNASMDTTPTPSIGREQEASAQPNDSSSRISDANEEEMNDDEMESNKIILTVGSHTLTATLADNASAAALREHLEEEILTVNLSDYGGFEKVGPLGMSLPTNNEQITTEAGDLILYQGNQFVLYYDTNSWSFTRLGKIDDVSDTELREILGSGNVTVTLSLPE